MKTKIFFSIVITAFVFAFFAPESVTKKVHLAGKVLYGAEGYVANRKKNGTIRFPNSEPITKAQVNSIKKIECDVPDKPESITGPSVICAGSTCVFTASLVNGADSYEWELPIGWVGNTTTNVMTAIAGEAGGDILVKAKNDCGVSEAKHFSAMLSSSPSVPVISTDGTEMISSVPEGNQWYFESNPIKDATGKTYTPTAEGKYHVCATNRNSCSVCSKVMESSELTVLVEASEGEQDEGLIFPNPSTGLFTIRAVNCNDFIIYNSNGELILSQKMDQEQIVVDLTWRPKGPYWVEFHYGNNTVTKKLLIN